MNDSTNPDMVQCSVCKQMTASLYMVKGRWGKLLCRMCRDRQKEREREKQLHSGSTMSPRSWLILIVALGGSIVWFLSAETETGKKIRVTIHDRLGLGSDKETDAPTTIGDAPETAARAPRPAAPTLGMSTDAASRTVTMNLRSDVLFEFGNASLKAAAGPTLRDAARFVLQRPKAQVIIRGYTDSIGTEQANLTLSRQRAEAVRDWMVKSGVPSKQLSVLGMGAKEPVAANTKPDGTDNPPGREQNRRVSLSIIGG